MILVGRHTDIDDIDQIYTDDLNGGVLAGRYLVEKQQCKRLCYLGYDAIECSKRRYMGFYGVAKKHGLAVDQFLVSHLGETDSARLIENDYDGVFCYNDELAYYLLYDASKGEEMNERFKNIHVVGYDALAHRIRGLKRITSVNSNYHEIAQAVVDLLAKRLEGKEDDVAYQRICFPVNLYLRNSARGKAPR